ncbi:MAG: site-specific DNA-methyltransferase [Alistipes senegalensis]|nr:site-specific DNA-methyltransferase [Oxalobacter formigenes]MCM1281691.1 site-specific DNA-methyltransferase [Alistipes senegalensis]
MDKMRMESPDMTEKNIEKIEALFPNCITEKVDENGKLRKAINFEMLKQMLSDEVLEGDEAYEFTWVGKKAAIVEAHSPIRKTLRPCQDESVDWERTENLYIKGDNLEVLKLLQESYLKKINLIYIDPPYNTGRNYIYRNDYSIDYEEYSYEAGLVNDEGARLVSNPVGSARYHSAWLKMIYERLLVARNLLSSNGILICAIDENEFSSLSLIMKEIFGESCYEHSYVSIMHNRRGQQGVNFSYVNEYLIFVYPSDGKKYLSNFPKEEIDKRGLRDSGTESDRKDAKNCFYPFYIKDNRIVRIGDVPSDSFHPKSANIRLEDGTIEIWPLTDEGKEKKWRYSRQSVENVINKLESKLGRKNYQIMLNQDRETIRSMWINPKYDSSEYGTKLIDKLMKGCSFTFPKSLYAVYDCIKAATSDDKEAIILDFFSGSSTTAHAVMKLNSEDNGNRKFIMVQLPESLKDALNRSGVNQKTKLDIQSAIDFLDDIHEEQTICGIGKERIRRAGAKIKEENSLTNQDLDIGFRVLKLDDSNMRDVYYSASDYSQDLLTSMESNIKPDRTDLDLLFGCLLEWGLPLSLPYQSEKIDGVTIHNYNNGDLIACFEENIPENVIKAIAKQKPLRAVFRDSSFADSPAKINVSEVFTLLAPDTKIKVI